jgi:hypothetical protein
MSGLLLLEVMPRARKVWVVEVNQLFVESNSTSKHPWALMYAVRVTERPYGEVKVCYWRDTLLLPGIHFYIKFSCLSKKRYSLVI